MQIFFVIILTVLAVVGLNTALFSLARIILLPDGKRHIRLITLDGDDADLRLRCEIQRMHLDGILSNDERAALALVRNCGEDVKSRCMTICLDNGVYFADEDTFFEALSEIL